MVMRVAIIVARILLGLVFFVFGLNGFLHFMPNPPPTPAAGAFFGALIQTGYMFTLIFGPQVVGGALLLLGVAVPFALVILAPDIVNIICFHIFLSPVPMQVVIALIVTALAAFLAWQYRDAFAPLFRSTPRS
jgi:putative oxidoreductase